MNDNGQSGNSSGGGFSELLERVRARTGSTLSSTARASRRRLDHHQAQKDLEKLYWKLGKEVVALVAAGEIDHPGLKHRAEGIEKRRTQLVATLDSGDE